ncbi:MAG: ParB/RepB/Spo0J family partition protein [Clostridia bacterium]|nr:ParB/RepB/Spo0J family partition protein [Oscillospiraceae bacterium]MBQ7006001.1 ParB/RepB/Spo0J family partition protein [Clostridia bacterium]
MITEKPKSAGQVLLIPNEIIYPNPSQPRRNFNQEELVNLAISIRLNGILQPITVRETENGYEVVSGERRLRASRLAGMLNVPCIVIEANNFKSAVYALIENLQRQNLGYFEEAAAIEKLMYDFGLSQDEVAKQLGKAPSTVSNKLRLLALPAKAREMLCENGLSERHARALLRVKEENIFPVLEKIIEKKLNVVQTEEYIEELLTEKAAKRVTKTMFSDVKIFLKTINHAVDTMKKAGIKADIKKEEKADDYVYHIKIPKKQMYKAVKPADGNTANGDSI